jgi:hypothetical protein
MAGLFRLLINYMKYRTQLLYLLGFLMLAAKSTSAAAPQLPRAAELRELLNPGTQLIFHGGIANIRAPMQGLFEDERGDKTLAPEDGTKTVSTEDIPRLGAETYTVVTVSAVTANEATLDEKLYVVNPLTKNVIYPDGFPQSIGHKINAGQPGETYCLLPSVLRELKESPDMKIVRGVYRCNGSDREAVTLVTRTKTSRSRSTYDAETGLRLSYYAVLAGPTVNAVLDDNWYQKTSLKSAIYANLEFVRNPQYPWAKSEAPTWVKPRESLHYAGTGGMPGLSFGGMMPMQLDIQINEAARGWASYSQRLSVVAAPTPGESVNGVSSFGGPWLPPGGLTGLTKGQVIDRIPGLNVILSVKAVDRNSVTFDFTSGELQSTFVYSLSSGVLLSFTHQTAMNGRAAQFSFGLNGGDKPAQAPAASSPSR